MTRETKIGLLVGLAFIIIVGILLSEPLNHAGDAQPAPLPSVGQNARLAISSPGTANTAPPPAISTQTQPGGAAAQQPVPTQGEVAKPHSGGITVVVGGNEGAGSPPISMQTEQPAAPQQPVTLSNNNGQSELPPQHTQPQPEPRPQQPVTPPAKPAVARGNGKPAAPARPNTAPPSNVEGDPILRGAHDAGEELVSADGRPLPGNTNTPPSKLAKPNSTKPAKQYEAGSGDTLSKMAAKFYGSSSKTYRDAIVAANPSLKGDPNKIIAGETYVIPAVENAGPTQTAPAPTQPKNEPKAAPKERSTPSNETYYTVKPGDSLWAIARDQCGDPAAVPAIQELNKDSLKGGTSVRAGMKLKLPNKPVASAN